MTIERFEITHDPEIGMIHRPHAHGYYVRYADHAAEVERLEREKADHSLIRNDLLTRQQRRWLANQRTRAALKEPESHD